MLSHLAAILLLSAIPAVVAMFATPALDRVLPPTQDGSMPVIPRKPLLAATLTVAAQRARKGDLDGSMRLISGIRAGATRQFQRPQVRR